MDVKEQSSQLHQLLLSPLHLWGDIQTTMIPGVSFLLLMAFKGNLTVQTIWWHSPFGYRTKIAIFLLLSYVAGKLLPLPLSVLRWLITWILKLRNYNPPQDQTNPLSHLPQEQRDIVTGALSLGPILATPGLTDKLAIIQFESAFYLAIGITLIEASLFPSDGYWRLVEVLAGIIIFAAGFTKTKEYEKSYMRHLGVGMANMASQMTHQQSLVLLEMFKKLGIVPSGPTIIEVVPAGDQKPDVKEQQTIQP